MASTIADIYDEQFNRNLLLAKSLMSRLRSRHDREICKKWIFKLCSLKSTEPTVKKNRNAFLNYMLGVLHQGLIEDLEGETPYPQYDEAFGSPLLAKTDDDPGFMSRWSVDKRTYVAAKPLPGRGALVYMAVSRDPSLGWDEPRRR